MKEIIFFLIFIVILISFLDIKKFIIDRTLDIIFPSRLAKHDKIKEYIDGYENEIKKSEALSGRLTLFHQFVNDGIILLIREESDKRYEKWKDFVEKIRTLAQTYLNTAREFNATNQKEYKILNEFNTILIRKRYEKDDAFLERFKQNYGIIRDNLMLIRTSYSNIVRLIGDLIIDTINVKNLANVNEKEMFDNINELLKGWSWQEIYARYGGTTAIVATSIAIITGGILPAAVAGPVIGMAATGLVHGVKTYLFNPDDIEAYNIQKGRFGEAKNMLSNMKLFLESKVKIINNILIELDDITLKGEIACNVKQYNMFVDDLIKSVGRSQKYITESIKEN